MDDEMIEEVRAFIDHVATEESIKVVAAYLFGSRARDDYSTTSDVDVVILSPDFAGIPTYQRGVPFYLAWEYPPDLELKCYTPEEFDHLVDRVSIARRAAKEGIAVA